MCSACGNSNLGLMWERLVRNAPEFRCSDQDDASANSRDGLGGGGAPRRVPAPSLAALDLEKVTVFRNGRVYTVEDDQPWAQAVVVRGRKIAYVGSDADAMKFAGPDAEVIDLDGRMCCRASSNRTGIWRPWPSPAAPGSITNVPRMFTPLCGNMPRRIRRRSYPGSEDVDQLPKTGPRKSSWMDLPIVPVLLISNDFHNYWVNSKFLELTGIGKDTPRDVVPGASVV